MLAFSLDPKLHQLVLIRRKKEKKRRLSTTEDAHSKRTRQVIQQYKQYVELEALFTGLGTGLGNGSSLRDLVNCEMVSMPFKLLLERNRSKPNTTILEIMKKMSLLF